MERKVCVLNLSTTFAWNMCPKKSNIGFHENHEKWEPSCSIRTDRQTQIRKDGHNYAFHNFVQAP